MKSLFLVSLQGVAAAFLAVSPVHGWQLEVNSSAQCYPGFSGHITSGNRTFCIKAGDPNARPPARGGTASVTTSAGSTNPDIIAYCTDIVGESYRLMEACIDMEEKSRANLGM